MHSVGWFSRWRGRGPRRIVIAAIAGLLVLAGTSAARAAIPDAAGVQITPPRLGLVEGEVLFWRPGEGDWEPAQLNLPLAAGDALAAREGKLELQIGRKAFVRAGEGTQLRLKSNEPDFVQFELSAGHVIVDLHELPHGNAVEVDTPEGIVRISRDGYYRLDVDERTTRLTVRRGGTAEVLPNGGSETTVATGDAVEIEGSSAATVTALAAPAFDEWDRWNYDRDEHFLAARRSYAVSEDVYGGAELEQYGSWRYVNNYGRVWAPYDVPAGWAPYTYGRWVSDPLYGWSWVDYAPWGWAPYHYGRWVYAGYWAWAPGPVLAVPVYSPALVAFFGGPYFSVGIGVPFVSWVPLGWGEPLVPWWGPVGFIGTPCWWGWGGPRVVNNIVINTGTTVNANSINLYRNAGVPGAVVSVPKDQFASRALERVRVNNLRPGDLKPVHGPLPVVSRTAAGNPAAASKIPMPALTAPRPATEARRDLARTTSQAFGAAERAAAPGRDMKTASSAFDRLHGAAPASAAGDKPGMPRTLDARQANGALGDKPPVPTAAFDALRNHGTTAPHAVTGTGPAANLQRNQPGTTALAKPTTNGAVQRFGGTQPPPLREVHRGTTEVQRTNPGNVASAPPLPHTLNRGSAAPAGGGWGKPTVPNMRQYQPSGAAPSMRNFGRAGASPSLGSVSRGTSGGSIGGGGGSIGGGGSMGGFSRGGGGGGGIPNVGRGGGGGMGGVMGGGKLGH